MKDKPRLVMLWILATLLLAAAPLLAQDSNLYGLSQVDYRLLGEANAATARARSLQFDYSLSLAIDGIPSGNLSLRGSGALITGTNPSLQFTLDGANNLAGPSGSITAEFRVVDGILYVNVVDAATGQFTGWTAQSLDDVARGLTRVSGAPVNADALAGFDLGPTVAALQPETFITIRRESDDSAAGHSAAHYVFDADFDTFVTTPFMQSVVQGFLIAVQGTVTPTVPTPSQLTDILNGSTLQIEQWIGLDDKVVHRTLLLLNLVVHPAALDTTGQVTTVALSFDITLDQYNEPVTISQPENAQVIASATPAPLPSSAAAAQPISANAPARIELSGLQPVDLTYTTAAPETVTVIARGLDAAVDTTLEILDSSGTTLAFNDDHPAATAATALGSPLNSLDSSVEDLALPATDDYIIRVNSYDAASGGPVEVTVESTAVTTTSSPPSSADSEIIAGSLSQGGVFAYSFAASQGETVTLTVRDTSDTLDPRLLLMDARFTRLAENDNHDSADPALDPSDSKIEDLTIPADGTYNLLVSDESDASGSFDLIIIRGGGTASAFIENAASPTADSTTIGLGNEVVLDLDGQTPATRTFYGDAGQRITISARAVNPPSPDMDIYITVFAPDGGELAYNDDHGTADTALGLRDARVTAVTLPTTGAYRIEVDSWFDIPGEVAVRVDAD